MFASFVKVLLTPDGRDKAFKPVAYYATCNKVFSLYPYTKQFY